MIDLGDVSVFDRDAHRFSDEAAIYGMKFRKYLGADKLPSDMTLAEADLLGKPSTGALDHATAENRRRSPAMISLKAHHPRMDRGVLPAKLNDQMARAAALAGELRKVAGRIAPSVEQAVLRLFTTLAGVDGETG